MVHQSHQRSIRESFAAFLAHVLLSTSTFNVGLASRFRVFQYEAFRNVDLLKDLDRICLLRATAAESNLRPPKKRISISIWINLKQNHSWHCPTADGEYVSTQVHANTPNAQHLCPLKASTSAPPPPISTHRPSYLTTRLIL
ncbi:hypothetical protein BKA63DRAFT_323834 [Paraphoma chrysanthemicola]|nr:hypothetical protein BKA63DRAFT_323834 [Paraphoma chrysanthemicola]